MKNERLWQLSDVVREMLRETGADAIGLSYTGTCILPCESRDAYEMRLTVIRPVHRVFFEPEALADDTFAAQLLKETCLDGRRKLAAELRAMAEKMDPR